jgi:hypothetical protein
MAVRRLIGAASIVGLLSAASLLGVVGSTVSISLTPDGRNGDVVVELDATAIDEGRAAKVELEPDLAKRIIDNPGKWYVNTHSASFEPPTGVARAQLEKADEADKPDVIDTGDRSRFAASQEAPDAGALVAGGLLIAAAAGGAAVVRRRSGTGS